MNKQYGFVLYVFLLVQCAQAKQDNFQDSFIDLRRSCSDLAEIIATINTWDNHKNSVLSEFNKYILEGNFIAPEDMVLEALAYAEGVVEQIEKKSQKRLDNINEALDILADQIKSGDLIRDRYCRKSSDKECNQTFDCFLQPVCCEEGPRGPRGHRGRRGPRGATGATGATGVFDSSSCVDICAINLTVLSCVDSLCVNTLSVVDEAISGTFSATDVIAQTVSSCDVIVGCNLIMNESLNPAIGNVIKAGNRFIHTFPAGVNTFMGSNAGNFTNGGSANTALGVNALTNLGIGDNNVAVGDSSMVANTDGFNNTAVGTGSLNANTTGFSNTAIGSSALNANTFGALNVAVGSSALPNNTTGIRNTAIGVFSMQNNTTGSFNTAVGQASLINNITGNNNVAVGDNAWSSGNENVMVGANTGNNGSQNVGVGFQNLQSNNSDHNVAVGHSSMIVSLTNGDNTAVGYQALITVRGGFNIALGSGAGTGSTLATSNNNIYIGNAGVNESGAIRIGTLGTHTTCFIQGIDGVVTGLPAVAVLVDANGQLGTISSTRRVKHAIQDMDDASADIFKLRPVTFIYNADLSETRQYGLIAEEVEEVFPAIVVHDKDGQPFTIQYHVLPILLLNELKKQHIVIENMNERLMALEARN